MIHLDHWKGDVYKLPVRVLKSAPPDLSRAKLLLRQVNMETYFLLSRIEGQAFLYGIVIHHFYV